MLLRACGLALICFILSSCAHIPIEHKLALQAQSSFVLIHSTETFTVENCYPDDPEALCQFAGSIEMITGVGSGGVVGHGESSTYVLTAAHVVSGFDDYSDVAPGPALSRLIYAYASKVGQSPRYIYDLYRAGFLRFVPGKNNYYASFSALRDPVKVSSVDCQEFEDICLIHVPQLVRVPKVSLSKEAPLIGQKVRSAAAPFGTAIPQLPTIPIFEGIFSGYDIETSRHPEYAWYTMTAAPGSSGALILNNRGELVGIVVGMSMGNHCTSQGCTPMRSGVVLAVPHSTIKRFLDERLR